MWDDGGDLLNAEGRFVRRVRRPQPGQRSSSHSRLPESAREGDLAWRPGRGPWNDSGAAAESPGREGHVSSRGKLSSVRLRWTAAAAGIHLQIAPALRK